MFRRAKPSGHDRSSNRSRPARGRSASSPRLAAAKFRRRGAGDVFEDAIKMTQGLAADLEGRFTDAIIEVQQKAFGLLHADPGHVLREAQARDLFEFFTKVE